MDSVESLYRPWLACLRLRFQGKVVLPYLPVIAEESGLFASRLRAWSPVSMASRLFGRSGATEDLLGNDGADESAVSVSEDGDTSSPEPFSLSFASSPSTRRRRASRTSPFGPRFLGVASEDCQFGNEPSHGPVTYHKRKDIEIFDRPHRTGELGCT